MKRLIALLMLPGVLVAQDILSISPAHPSPASTVTLSYNTRARGAAIMEPKAPKAHVLTMRAKKGAFLQELPMTRTGNVFSASFPVEDDHIAFFIRIVDGDLVDDNGEHLWTLLVYDDKGMPVEGALTTRGQAFLYGRAYNLKCERNVEKAVADLSEEVRAHPDFLAGWLLKWQAEFGRGKDEAIRTRISSELESVYGRVAKEQDDVANLLSWFERTGQSERAEKIAATWKEKDPKGRIAEDRAWRAIRSERDRKKRLALLEELDNEFPLPSENQGGRDGIYVSYALSAGEYDKAAQRLEGSAKPSAMAYNNLAWQFIEKGERLEEAVGWAKRGVDLARTDREGEKPAYMAARDWKRSSAYALGMVLDTYAYGLDQLGQMSEAEGAYEEAWGALEGKDAEVSARYVTVLLKTGKVDKALEVAREAYRKGRTNDLLTDAYRQAFAEKNGSPEGFDKEIEKLRADARTELKKKLKEEMLDKPSIDFALKALDGSTVSLSGLRGKVVVLDFWATWCGPCIQSFPFLQKVVDSYKDNPNIVILALNTWENTEGAEREKSVRKFIREKKYTFTVLFDDDFVTQYGVEGIPTKVIIDQKGRIRFKDIGFGGGEDMMNKMELQFEMLLGGDVSQN